MICEQASRSFWHASGWRSASTWEMRQDFLRKQLSGFIPSDCWPVRPEVISARGVVISQGFTSDEDQTIFVITGVCLHLVRIRAAQLCDARAKWFVQTDDLQRTSVPEIFVRRTNRRRGLDWRCRRPDRWPPAGGRSDSANCFAARKKCAASHARSTGRCSTPRTAAHARPETIVCRCEMCVLAPCATPLLACRQAADAMWNGPWQDACADRTHFLFDWSPDSVRHPFPTRLKISALASKRNRTQPSDRRRHEVEGVMPAITTCFDENLKSIMTSWQALSGCSKTAAPESFSLGRWVKERRSRLKKTADCADLRKTVRGRAPIVASISTLPPPMARPSKACRSGCDALRSATVRLSRR